ncbi:DNA polymerase delta, subunit 4-domain-containing protein [Umbelopsis sp. PMI_123]|nr:DNA polymerase delta, subunit 4-domain-containing protein [Umbelopsis sp. PMI_123]
MPPKRRAAVSTQQKLTDTGLKTSKKRRVVQKPIDLTKSLVKPEKNARSTSPVEDIAAPTSTEDDDDLHKEEEIVHSGIDDDLELRKRRQPAAKPKVIEIHTKGQSKEDKVLRAFDLNFAFGSCVGITRLERWQRAEKLGLNPPQEVKLLLEGKNADKEDVKECLFHGRV